MPYLQLVVPAVGACSDLQTMIQLVGATKHVGAQVLDAGGSDVIQTDDKEGAVDDTQCVAVHGITLELFAEIGPVAAVLGGQDANGVLCDLGDGYLGGIAHDGAQVGSDFLFSEGQVAVLVKDLEMVELGMGHDDNVARVLRGVNVAAVLGGLAGGGKETGELGHAEGSTSKDIRFEGLCSQGFDESQGRVNEGCGTDDLVVALRGRVVFQDKEWVQVQDDWIRGL